MSAPFTEAEARAAGWAVLVPDDHYCETTAALAALPAGHGPGSLWVCPICRRVWQVEDWHEPNFTWDPLDLNACKWQDEPTRGMSPVIDLRDVDLRALGGI